LERASSLGIGSVTIKYPSMISTQLLKECEAMATYALSSGLPIPATVLSSLESVQKQAVPTDTLSKTKKETAIQQLSYIHTALAAVVAPIAPRSILFFEAQSAEKNFWHFLSPIALIRQMLLIAVVFLALLIAISLSPYINNEESTDTLFSCSGLPLLFNFLFLLSAAGIGASFAALFKSIQSASKGFFDPYDVSTYYVDFVLGLIGGIIIAELIPLNLGGDSSFVQRDFIKLTLALLGGFSARAVYRILNRLVRAVESLVKESDENAYQQQLNAAKNQQQQKIAQNKVQLASKLNGLLAKISAGTDKDTLYKEVQSTLYELLPEANDQLNS